MDSREVFQVARNKLNSWFDRFDEMLEEAQIDYGEPQQKRQLTDGDVEGWFKTAHNPLREEMEKKHPYRWARLLRDVRWIKKEMVKLGLNPNDFKWWVG